MFPKIRPDKTMDQLINEISIIVEENPKAKLSLVKLTQGLYMAAKRINTDGFTHNDMAAVGVYLDNIKHHHPKAFEYYDVRAREFLIQALDKARY